MWGAFGVSSLLGIETAAKFLIEKVGEPIIQDFLTSKTTISVSSLGNEVRDRLRTQLPINHDVERAVRVAQLQALRLTLSHYEKIVKATNKHQPIDDGTGPIFVDLLRGYLNKSFFRRPSVELDRHAFENAYAEIAADIRTGSGVPDSFSDDEAVVAALKTALEKSLNLAESVTGIRSVPEGFCRLLREGHRAKSGKILPPWAVSYRAFLCEQVKANPRFRDIFQTTMLVTINETVSDGVDFLKETATDLRSEIFSQTEIHLGAMRAGFDVIGDQLAAIETEIALQSECSQSMAEALVRIENHLADLVLATSEREPIGPVLQRMLSSAYDVIGTESYAASERVANRHLQNPIYGRDFDRENLDQFLNWQDRGILLLTGDAGAGKSRLMAEMAAAWDQPGQTVLRHFFSLHESYWGSRDQMIANLARQASQKLGSESLGDGEPGDLKRLADRLSSLLARDRNDDRLIIVIDSLDESAELIEPFQVPLGAGVYILLSIRADESMLPHLAQKWLDQTRSPQRLSRQYHLEMIDSHGIASWLTDATGKSYCPTHDLVQRALRACDGVPLFAEFLIPGAIAALEAGKKNVVPESFDAYVRSMLEGLIELKINPGQTGWSLQSILDLFGLAAVAWAALPARICQKAVNGDRLDRLDPRIKRWFTFQQGKSGLLLALRHPRLVKVFLRVLPQLDVDPSDCRDSLIKVLREHQEKEGQVDARWHALRWLPSYLRDAGCDEDAADLLGDLTYVLDRLRQRPEAFEVSALADETINLNSELDGHHQKLASLSRLWSETETAVTKPCQLQYSTCQPVFDQICQIVYDRPLRETFLNHSRWDRPTISLLRPLPYLYKHLFRSHDNAHKDGIKGIQQIGNRIVSWGKDGALRFWSLKGQAMDGGDPKAHSFAIWGIQQIGDRIVSWGYDGALRFWSLTGQAMDGGDLEAHRDSIRGIQQIGDHIVSWGDEGALRFWSLTGQPMDGGDLRAHSGVITGIQQIGDHIVSWGRDGALRFWSLTGQAMDGGDPKAHSDAILGIQQIGDRIVSWGDEGALRFWSLTGQPMDGGDPKAHSGFVYGGIQQIGDRIVSWGWDGALRFWSLTGQPMDGGDPKAHSGFVYGGIQQIGDRIVSWGDEGALRFWSLTGQSMDGGDPKAHSGFVYGGIQQIGDRIVSWGHGALRFWSLTGQPMDGGDLKAHSDAITGIQQIGDHIVSWGWDGALRFWSLTGQSMDGGDLKAHSGFVYGGIQQIGDRIVSWGDEGALRFWSLTGQPMDGGDLKAHSGVITGIQQIGDRIVSWGDEGALRFWSLTGQPMDGGDLRAHSDAIKGIQQIGDRIVSWGDEGALRFWSLTGEHLMTWWSPRGTIHGIKYTGNMLYLLSETGPIPFVFEE